MLKDCLEKESTFGFGPTDKHLEIDTGLKKKNSRRWFPCMQQGNFVRLESSQNQIIYSNRFHQGFYPSKSFKMKVLMIRNKLNPSISTIWRFTLPKSKCDLPPPLAQMTRQALHRGLGNQMAAGKINPHRKIPGGCHYTSVQAQVGISLPLFSYGSGVQGKAVPRIQVVWHFIDQ